MRTLISDVLLLAGAAWSVLAAIGMLKFVDVFGRLHAGTKATTLGLALVLAGAALRLEGGDAAKLVLAGLLVFLTAPVGAHLVGRAAHHTRHVRPFRIDTVDELADADRPGQPG